MIDYQLMSKITWFIMIGITLAICFLLYTWFNPATFWEKLATLIFLIAFSIGFMIFQILMLVVILD